MDDDHSNGFHDGGVNRIESLEGMAEGSELSSLIKWINDVLPQIKLPLEASEEELRAWLTDGSVLCSILDKLIPGSVEMGGGSNLASVERFLVAIDELGLPSFEKSDLEQDSMMPVLQCLETLKSHFNCNVGRENIKVCPRKRWELSEQGFIERTDCSLGDALMSGDHSIKIGEVGMYRTSNLKDQHGLQGPALSGIQSFSYVIG
ncbi:Kinesin-like protein [Quillaja saponaria]|uniref:Kinesin-like protein n=1 Tax=Quillaja saponaria TaxID=32244 RepID=A0AAD7PEV0_QUISA|nr:Kinesin-like protein [Quillaja saponaria]